MKQVSGKYTLLAVSKAAGFNWFFLKKFQEKQLVIENSEFGGKYIDFMLDFILNCFYIYVTFY